VLQKLGVVRQIEEFFGYFNCLLRISRTSKRWLGQTPPFRHQHQAGVRATAGMARREIGSHFPTLAGEIVAASVLGTFWRVSVRSAGF